LKQQLPVVDDSIRYVIPVMLDKASVEIGPWSGYNVLAQYHPAQCTLQNVTLHQKLTVPVRRILSAYRNSINKIDKLQKQKSGITIKCNTLNSAKGKAALSQLESLEWSEITMDILDNV